MAGRFIAAAVVALWATSSLAAWPEYGPADGGVRRAEFQNPDLRCSILPPDASQLREPEAAARAYLALIADGRFREAFDRMTPIGQSAQPFADFARRAARLRRDAAKPLSRPPFIEPRFNEATERWENYMPAAVIEGDIGDATNALCGYDGWEERGAFPLTHGTRQIFLSFVTPTAPSFEHAFFVQMVADGDAWRVGGVSSDGEKPVMLGDFPVPMPSGPPPKLVPREPRPVSEADRN